MAIGVPGWPEFAFWIASIDSVRMVLTQRVSMSVAMGWATVATNSILVNERQVHINRV
jgi:hypothetical protein